MNYFDYGNNYNNDDDNEKKMMITIRTAVMMTMRMVMPIKETDSLL